MELDKVVHVAQDVYAALSGIYTECPQMKKTSLDGIGLLRGPAPSQTSKHNMFGNTSVQHDNFSFDMMYVPGVHFNRAKGHFEMNYRGSLRTIEAILLPGQTWEKLQWWDPAGPNAGKLVWAHRICNYGTHVVYYRSDIDFETAWYRESRYRQSCYSDLAYRTNNSGEPVSCSEHKYTRSDWSDQPIRNDEEANRVIMQAMSLGLNKTEWRVPLNNRMAYTYDFSKGESSVSYKRSCACCDSVRSAISSAMVRTVPRVESSTLGDLAYEAVDAFQPVQCNSWSTVWEILSLPSELINLYSLLKGKVTKKSISSLFLSLKYGIRLTYKDVMDTSARVIDMALQDYSAYNRMRSQRNISDDQGMVTSVTYSIKISPFGVYGEIIKNLYNYRILPGSATLWDLIPFSFVVDWFYDLSRVFEILDTSIRYQNYHVFEVMWSEKTECTDFLLPYYPDDVLVWNVHATRYVRDIASAIHAPTLFSRPSPTVSKHWAELGALYFQRTK